MEDKWGKWMILGSLLFMVVPIAGFLQRIFHFSYIASTFMAILIIIGLAVFFRCEILMVDRILKRTISIKFLKEFVFIVLFLYGLIITVFGTMYYFIGLISQTNVPYFEWFYFSVITLTTVGYGDVTPINNLMKILVSLESFIGFISPSLIFTIGLGLILKENKI